MDKALIVKILVPIIKSDGLKGYRFGTGCAVGQGQILTARHVVCPDHPDKSRPIRVLWYHFEKGNLSSDHYATLPEAKIKWVGKDKDLDAALLDCDRHPDSAVIESWPLDDQLPVAGSDWDSRGFPTFARLASRKHFDCSGTIGRAAKTDRELTLSVDQWTWVNTPEDVVKDWAGASGMPVLCGNRVVGVVKQVLTIVNPPQFPVVPTSLLLADDEFRAAYRRPAPPDWVGIARGFIIDVLESSQAGSVASAQLAKVLNVEDKDKLRSREGISDSILAMSLTDALDKALEVQSTLLRVGDRKAAAVIAELVQAFLPDKHGEGAAIEQVRTHRGEMLIEVPCRSETVAEILMAAADQRTARFAPMRDRDDFPRGVARLAPPPEAGRDPHGEVMTDDIRYELANAFESLAPSRIESAFAEYLNPSLTSTS